MSRREVGTTRRDGDRPGGAGYGIALVIVSIANATAADWVPVYSPADGRTYVSQVATPVVVAPPRSPWQIELGTRYWISSGRTQYDLYVDSPGTTFSPISRLTYTSLLAHSGEVFGRADHATGAFVKGFIGGGVIPGGKLQDEDFPPFFVPYSSTDSEQRGGALAYGTLDIGWSWRAERRLRLGIFAGYHHTFERLNGYGCNQTASHPGCSVPISTSVHVIKQETNWGAARLGINADWWITDRLRLTTDVAWLPYVHLDAKDTHLLRPDFLGTQNGGGVASVQFEAVVNYSLTDALSVGLGGRYWKMQTEPGAVAMQVVGGGPLRNISNRTLGRVLSGQL